MRRDLFGSEPQLATIALLVCGPVLFGLALILLESVRGTPAALVGIATHPADNSGYLIAIALWVQLFAPSLIRRDQPENEDEAAPARYPTDVYWAMAVGMLVAIGIARKDLNGPAGWNLNFAAYLAMAVGCLHLGYLFWKYRRGRAQRLGSPI